MLQIKVHDMHYAAANGAGSITTRNRSMHATHEDVTREVRQARNIIDLDQKFKTVYSQCNTLS